MKKLEGVTWSGLDSFKRELQAMTQHLVSETEGIMVQSAFDAGDAIRSAYPYVEGGLRRGIVVVPHRGLVLAGAELKNIAPHAWLYEHGTRPRANRFGDNRGRMPARPTFDPIAQSYRAQAIAQVVDLLYQSGADTVTGEE
jgi:hypothetical protein